MKTEHSIIVPVSGEAAFAYLSQVSNETRWRQSIVGSRYVDSDVPALGVHGETDVAMGSKRLTMRWVVTGFQPGTEVSWTLDGDPWHGGGGYRVTGHDGASVIRARVEVRLKGIARAFEPLLWLQLRQGLRGDLRRLAGILTADAHGEGEGSESTPQPSGR